MLLTPLTSRALKRSAEDHAHSRLVKLAVVSVALAVAAGFLAPHVFGRLFPFANVAFTLGVVTVVLLAWRDTGVKDRLSIYIGCIVTLSVAYRLRIVAFPSSMFGIDPDAYAIEMAEVVRTGRTSVISYDFYRAAPFHLLEGVISNLLASLPVAESTYVYALFISGGVPLLAAAFVSKLRMDAPRTMILAAGGASVVGYTLRYSYAPIAQTTGIFFMTFGLFTTFTYVTSENDRWFYLVVLFTTGAVFTHKLAGITFTIGVFGAFLLSLLHPTIRGTGIRGPILRVIVVSLFLLAFQQWYLTGFGSVALFKLYHSVIDVGTQTGQAMVPTAAVNPYTTRVRLFRLSYLLALMIMSGLAWLGWFWVTLRQQTPRRDVVFLGIVAAISGLIPLAYPSWINPVRMVFSAEILLVVVSAVGFYWQGVERLDTFTSLSRFVIPIIMIVFLMTAGMSPIASPDYEPISRSYLTEEETHAKSWGAEHATQLVGTDQFYAHETPPSRIGELAEPGQTGGGGFIDISPVYLNKNFSAESPPLVAHRHCVNTLRTSFGVWQLTYNPDRVLSATSDRVYASGCVSYFRTAPPLRKSPAR